MCYVIFISKNYSGIYLLIIHANTFTGKFISARSIQITHFKLYYFTLLLLSLIKE